RGPRYLMGRTKGGGKRGDGGAIFQAEQQKGARLLGPGQHLEGHLAHGRQGPEGAAEQLGEIVARDVLHHAAAGLDGLAAPGGGAEAEKMIPRRALADPAGASHVAPKQTADRPASRCSAPKGGPISWFEGQLLVSLRKRRADLGQRRSSARGKDQFLGLVERDAAQAAHVEGGCCLHWPPPAALAALAQNLERQLFREGPGHRFLQLFRGSGL